MNENTFLKEFSPYRDNLNEVINRTLLNGRHKNEDTLDFLKGYYIFVNFLVAEKDVFNDMPDGFKVLLSKASLDLFAIYNTVSAGCMSQALTLVRSLFESSVYLTYIDRDYQKHLKYYENYKDFLAYHKWKEEKGSFDFPKEKEDEIVRKYNAIKADYDKRGAWYKHPLLEDMKKHPAFRHQKKKFPTFKAMCIITENEELYKRLYSTMSESVHGSSIIGKLFLNEKDNISIAPNFSTFYTNTTSAFAILFLHNIVSIGLTKQINKGHSEYEDYLNYSKAYADLLISNEIEDKT